MINIDVSVIYQMINFLVLLIVLNFILYRPIRNVIRQRQREFQELQAEIEKFHRDRELRIKELEENLKEARQQGLEEREKLREEALTEERRIIEEISTKVEKEIREFQGKLSEEMKQVREQLMGQIEVFSKELASKILGRSIS